MEGSLKNRELKSSSVCEAHLKGTAAPCKWGDPLPDSILKSFSSSLATRCRTLLLFQEVPPSNVEREDLGLVPPFRIKVKLRGCMFPAPASYLDTATREILAPMAM